MYQAERGQLLPSVFICDDVATGSEDFETIDMPRKSVLEIPLFRERLLEDLEFRLNACEAVG